MKEKINDLANWLHVSEFIAIVLIILIIGWFLSWVFLPFSTWGIKDKLDEVKSKLDAMKEVNKETNSTLKDILSVMKQIRDNKDIRI